MRSERKMVRSLLARFMVLMMVINLLGGINPSAVKAGPDEYYKNGSEKQENGVTISKKVTRYNAADGTYDIELKVKGSTEVVQNNKILDIVLVMDTSGSMEGKSLENAKKAANNFVDKLLPQNNNVNIGIVSFAEKGEIKSGLTRNVTTLKNAINGLKADGGTYTQQGLEKAAAILNGTSAEHKKVMVVIGDGEPTYANGEHPNFDKGGFYRIHNPATKRKGYEQWYGNAFKWLGRGYNSAHRNYLVKLINGGFGNGTKERKGWGHVSWPFNLMDDYFEKSTLKAADTIKNNTEIITVGIDIENNDLAKSIMNKLATSGKYLKAGAVAGELDKILDDIAEKLQKKVSEGVITDNMSEYVNCLVNSVKLSGKSENLSPEISDKSITVRNINLGKDEELIISYKVKLKDNWKDGEFHKANGKTTLLPTKNGQEMDFNVPEIRSDRATTSIVVNKKWVGNKVPDGLNELTFEVIPKTSENYSITVKKDDNWTGKLENLPKYKNGSKIEYNVAEPAGNNYEKVGNITKSESPNGDLTFEVKNRSVEKVSLSVEKKWDAPEDVKDDVKFLIYKGNETNPVRTVEIAKAQSGPVLVGNLDKYDEQGEEIVYRVKEEGTTTDNKVTLNNGKIFDVTVDNNGNAWTVKNKYANLTDDLFEVTLKKTWVGGIGDKAEFVFKNTSNGAEKRAILKKSDFTGKTVWEGKVSLPKYNADNSPAVYSVAEGEVKGFASVKTSLDNVSAAIPSVSFTNTRETKDIKVTKVWKNTPSTLKKEVEVVLWENNAPSTGNDAIQTTVNGVVEFKNLPKTDESGNDITYTVKENNVDSALFDAAITSDNDGNFTITNTYKNLATDKISVNLVKKWRGGVGKNVAFKFINSKTNEEVKELVLDANTTNLTSVTDSGTGETTWKFTVNDLAKYDTAAEPVKYKVTEVLSNNKTFELQGSNEIAFNDNDTVTFINNRVMRMLTVEKRWVGPAADKAVLKIVPSDKIVTLDSSNNWKQSLDLPVYDLEGNAIEYTVTENETVGYKAKEKEQKISFVDPTHSIGNRNLTFTNEKLLENKFTVHKTWQGMPATSVSFGLYDGTDKVDTLVLTAANAQAAANNVWTGKFEKDVPAYNSNNQKIGYVVKELDENGNPVESGEVRLGGRTYKVESSLAQNTDNTYNFTNTDATRGDVTTTKIWKGRPKQQADFGLFKKVGNNLIPVPNMNETIDTANPEKWIVKYVNLPYTEANGDLINYVIKEVYYSDILEDGEIVDLYGGKYKVSYDNEGNITNTELINITVKKVWDANVPMSEQKSVEAAIFNGATEVDSVKLNEGNGWQHTFTNLPYLENGYTVKETAVNGAEVNDDLKKLYDIVVDKENIKETTTVTIKNSFKLTVPAEDKIKVVKQWMVNPGNKEVTVKVFKKTIGTPAEPSKWLETSDFKKLRGGYVLETDFNKPADAEDYYVLETAIGGTELTEDEIQNILNSNNLETVQYKIGEYDVLVKEPEDRTFFIKNSNDKKLTELNVEKQWSAHTLARYVQPVKVQLYAETGGVLEAVGSPVELNSAKWKTRFKGLDKYDNNGKEIKYHVAEVAVADEMKNDVTLSDIQNGYKIGKYDVAVDGDGTENIVIRNDVNLVDITARKDWGTVSESNRKPVEFTLYKREGAELKEVAGRTLTGAGGNWTVEFKDQPRADENGEEFTYYVFETKIDGTAVGIDPLAGVGYTVDPITQTILYTTGTINNGKYSVEISVNAVNSKEIVVKNSFTANNSGGIIVPPIPGFDPNPPAPGNNTPAVDVPDDTTPQGNANTDKTNTEADNTGADNADDDGVVEIDEDDTPEGKAKDGADNSSPQGTTDIGEDETPQGRAALPKTGGTAGDFFGIIGLGLIGLGLVFKKRKN